MVENQKNCKIPLNLIPTCPVCGGKMDVNLRCDGYFVEDENWHQANQNYETFLEENSDKKILFLELGVGMNTPGIIKFPFWRMTYNLDNATYVCLNLKEAWAPEEIKEKAICVNQDIKEIVTQLISG